MWQQLQGRRRRLCLRCHQRYRHRRRQQWQSSSLCDGSQSTSSHLANLTPLLLASASQLCAASQQRQSWRRSSKKIRCLSCHDCATGVPLLRSHVLATQLHRSRNRSRHPVSLAARL